MARPIRRASPRTGAEGVSPPAEPPPGGPPLLLIASDQEWAARSLQSIFAPAGYAVLRARGGREALRLTQSAHPDAILVEAHMPDLDALAICRALRADPAFSEATPIIVTTSGHVSRAERLAFLRAGAWDCCSAPIDGENLLARMQTYVRAKRARDRALEEALVDRATGLYSLGGVKRRLREAGAEARRRGAALSCIVLGPDTGDGDATPGEAARTSAAVERVAQLMRRLSRESDVLGRLGPTELAIIAPGTTKAGAERMIDRLRAAIADQPAADGDGARPTIRAGYCATADFAAEQLDAMELLRRATSALRDGRTSGGTTVMSSLRAPEAPA